MTTRNVYGTVETNYLPNMGDIHDQHGDSSAVDWNDQDLKAITRLRLLSDPGLPFWDISYCYGILKDGKLCKVDFPFSQLPKKNMFGEILYWAKREKVFAKGLGLFDQSVITKVC